MSKAILLLPLFVLAGCISGNTCNDATNAVTAAEAAKEIADTIAAANPQSARMQQAAYLAETSLNAATTAQAIACQFGG